MKTPLLRTRLSITEPTLLHQFETEKKDSAPAPVDSMQTSRRNLLPGRPVT